MRTREQWAKDERTFYLDDVTDVRTGVSRAVTDYGTAEEIATAITELEAQARDYLRAHRLARRAAADLVRRPGERSRAWCARMMAMSEAESAQVGAVGLQLDRLRAVRAVATALREGDLPAYLHPIVAREILPVAPVLRRLWARYQQACDAAVAAAEERRRQRPIDDAAWAKERERCARIEAMTANASWCARRA